MMPRSASTRSATRKAAKAAMLVVGAVALAGCIDALVVEFDGCTHEGVSLDIGAVVPTASGCGTCTCGADGIVSCEERTCCVAPDGTTIEPGKTWADACTVCECGEDGSFGCGVTSPCACTSSPGCPDMPNCVAFETCDESTGTWSCNYDCTDPCATAEVPMCKAPPGCTPEFYCDELSGTYVCAPTCICAEEPGQCATTPGCTSTLYCDEQSGGWYCVDDCPCGFEPPNCGYFASLACDGDVWGCETMGSFCGDTIEPCPPSPNPSCWEFPVCDVMAQGWSCVEECPVDFCMGEPAPCPSDPAGCTYLPVCQDAGWACVLHCF